MSGTEHTRPMRGGTENFPRKSWPRWRSQEKRENAQFTLAHRQRKADLDMREQLRDLGSERDWYRLNTVGVHLRTSDEPLAEWEVALMGDAVWEFYKPTLVHTSISTGYEASLDAYFIERASCAMTVEPIIEPERRMSAWERKWAEQAERKRANTARKRAANLAARKRTLTDEQRREILRRESVGMRGYSRV